jgi:hypothetical protein
MILRYASLARDQTYTVISRRIRNKIRKYFTAWIRGLHGFVWWKNQDRKSLPLKQQYRKILVSRIIFSYSSLMDSRAEAVWNSLRYRSRWFRIREDVQSQNSALCYTPCIAKIPFLAIVSHFRLYFIAFCRYWKFVPPTDPWIKVKVLKTILQSTVIKLLQFLILVNRRVLY